MTSLEGLGGRVALAAVNGPSSVVLSGDEDAVSQLAGLWESRSRKTKRLRVSHAFHSHRMEGMLDRFAEVAAEVSFGSPRIPIVSNLTGEAIGAETSALSTTGSVMCARRCASATASPG